MKLRSWQIWALMLAVLIRALVPVGYMLAPAEGDATFPRVVICTSAGMKLIRVDADRRPAGEHGGQAELAPCAFAPLPSMALLPMPDTGPLAFTSSPAWLAVAEARIAALRPTHAWHARAPPA